jgi:MoaA/NifB/PqqE/SkfB family radical SAM enzyme
VTPLLNTNGYLLTRSIIDGLNDAGLYGMQLSIDNVKPNAMSKKSLRPLLPKLRLLARHARFHVRINTVLGAGPPEEAIEVARTVVGFGFASNCSLLREATGAMREPDPRTRAAYDTIRGLAGRLPALLDDDYTRTLLDRGAMDWKCRAGARTFLVCERGLVHPCQPRHDADAVPLENYTVEHIRRAFDAPKSCAATCPIAYAHHASRLDAWRPQNGAPIAERGRRSAALVVAS